MKKTNFTLSSSCRRISALKHPSFALLLMLSFFAFNAFAQGPNCTDVNASIHADNYARVGVTELITNFSTAATPIKVVVENRYGGVIWKNDDVSETDIIELPACNYLGEELKVNVSNDDGDCWSKLTFKQGNGPVLESFGKVTVWCLDKRLKLAPTHPKGFGKPSYTVPCNGTAKGLAALPDWIDPYPCDSDTAKVIYRTWEAFDKHDKRGTVTDTIIVLKLPQITKDIVICPKRDTVYCDYITYDNGTPKNPKDDYVCDGYPEWECPDGIKVILPGIEDNMISSNTDDCDTLCLQETTLSDTKCGVIIDVESTPIGGSCPNVVKKKVSIKQTCYARNIQPICTSSDEDNSGVTVDPVADESDFLLCETWKMFMDTLGPMVVAPKGDHLTTHPEDGEVYAHKFHTDSHGCYADIMVPSVSAKDICSGVKYGKAMVGDDLGTVALKLNGNKWEHTGRKIRIPHSPYATRIVYEIYDSCHNIGRDTIYVVAKDLTKPVVVMDRAVTVTLSDKKVWVDAETFNENSWDNCGINLMLARRTDWATFCVDLCSNPKISKAESFKKLPSILSVLKDSKKPLEYEVEHHYAKAIEWVKEDNDCGDKIASGWYAAIWDYWAKNCPPADEHGNSFLNIGPDHFKYGSPSYSAYVVEHFGSYENYQEAQKIGGGWSKEVPFGCDDACQDVKVELLVMDYWCNWSKGWATAYVEDPQPAKLLQELPDVHVSCEAYKMYYSDIVDAAVKAGNSDAGKDEFAALDDAFGKYHKAWENDKHQPVDHEGNVLNGTFKVKNKYCDVKTEKQKIADTLHDGTIVWKEVVTGKTILKEKSKAYKQGYVGILCSAKCKEDVWPSFDHCGNGKIVRRFYVTSGCGKKEQTIELKQTIYVKSACSINKYMFSVPENDQEICVKALEYDNEGNLVLPTGEVKLHDGLADALCLTIGIGKKDKIYAVEGETNKYKVIRTWDMVDWCYSGESEASARVEGNWKKHGGKLWCEQKIIINVDPDCEQSSGDASIAGNIFTESRQKIEKVDIKLTYGNGAEKNATVNGSYEYAVTSGDNVQITPTKNTLADNGVSVRDIVSIQRSLLGKGNLSGKYAQIAADVDANGKVDARDLIEIKRLILGKIDQFSKSPSWRFYSENGDKQSVSMTASGPMKVNFIGVKIGDVNNDNNPSRERNALNLVVENQTLEAGNEYEIPVRAANFNDLRGLQYTLHTTNAKVVGIQSGALKVTKDNYFVKGNKASHIWFAGENTTVGQDEVLFTLVVKVDKTTTTGEALSLSNELAEIEAYNGLNESLNINLSTGTVTDKVVLYQNVPNPVEQMTTIAFELVDPTDAKLSIYDITGKVVKVYQGDFQKGYNEVTIDNGVLNLSGVVYYQLDTKTQSHTKKMIILE